MPSIFHWKPKKLAATIRVKSPTLKIGISPANKQHQDLVEKDDKLKQNGHHNHTTTTTNDPKKDEPPLFNQQSPDASPRRSDNELPYIDRSSSPSTANFPLKSRDADAEMMMRQNAQNTRHHMNELRQANVARPHSPQRRISPQRPLQNANYEQQYFMPQRQNGDYMRLSRVQRNVHFNDELEELEEYQDDRLGRGNEGLGGTHHHQQQQQNALSNQSNSVPATPLTSNREPFSGVHHRQHFDDSNNQNGMKLNEQHNNDPYLSSQLDTQPVVAHNNYSNQDQHNYPPPPYTTVTQQQQQLNQRFSAPSNPLTNLEPLSMLPPPQHHYSPATKPNQYRQPSPQSPLHDRHLSLRPQNDSHESYFNGSDVVAVPPRPPRQQQQQLFQRSNSAGSSTTGSTRAQHLLHQLHHQTQQQQSYPKENRANLILQQLRADDGALSESDVSTNEPMYHHHQSRASFGRGGSAATANAAANNQGMMHSKGIVYLEFNKEVKRSNLPSRLCTFEQIKSLFLRSFPNLTLQFLNQEHVKIYIADRHSTMSGNGDNVLFYELEDLNDVKDQSVLKIHQSQVYRDQQQQGPMRFTDIPPIDYISEPEIEERAKRYASYRARPASAVPETNRMQFTTTNSTTPIGQQLMLPNGNKQLQVAKPSNLSSHHFEAYYDPYYSDASSQGPRSGSITPIIDKETRQRVETMERQLAGLSTLVRSALISQGTGGGSGGKDASPDMMDLGRRLLEMQSDAVERFGLSSATNSNASSMYALMNGKQLIQVRRGVHDMRVNLNELRDFIELDKQSRVDLLRDTFTKIIAQMDEFMRQQQQANNQNQFNDQQLKQLKGDHQLALKSLEDSIQSLEQKIELRRVDVLSKNHKLRMAEVDTFHGQLHSIDQQNSKLRDQYMQLEDEACKLIDHYKEAIDSEANFLRREPTAMDQCAKRCQALNNMLATMKKLALVQDPTLYDRSKSILSEGNANGVETGKLPPPKVAPKPNGVNLNGSTNGTNGVHQSKNEQLPPLPNSPQRVTSPNPIRSVSATSTPAVPPLPQQTNANVLDSILDELNHTANSLPKLQGIEGGQLVNGKGPLLKQAGVLGAKKHVEASATLTLKEPQQQHMTPTQQQKTATNVVQEKYDNIEENLATTPVVPQTPVVKFSTPSGRVQTADPRRHFVKTETVKFRPTNSGHVVLNTARP